MDKGDKIIMVSSGLQEEGLKSRLKSRKGFGFRVRQATTRPSNTSIRDLLDDRCTEAVLAFLGATRVGEVKGGVLCT